VDARGFGFRAETFCLLLVDAFLLMENWPRPVPGALARVVFKWSKFRAIWLHSWHRDAVESTE